MKNLCLLFIILSSYLVSCQSPLVRQNLTFLKYFNHQFPNITLKDKALIFLIPDKYCSSCQKTFESIKVILKSTRNVYIISGAGGKQVSIGENITYLTDKKSAFEKLNLGISGAGLVVIDDRKISKIMEVNSFNELQLFELLQNYNKK